nr:hypothetical protein [Tanacetum cinerariifolium]
MNYAKKIMINSNIKVKDIVALVLKKYKCKVSVSQARRGKIKALQQYQTYLEDHYGMLWAYATKILNSNKGSTCKVGVDAMPDGKAYFSYFYVCFKAVNEGWLEGYIPNCMGMVSVENKDNWSWFMQCLIDDLGIVDGEALIIISDQHKGIIEAAKDVMPLSEHRQCARHIFANFKKRFTGLQFRSLFWQADKPTYPAKFEKIMQEIKDPSLEAHKHLMERNLKSWSRAFFRTDRVYDAVKNGISECFNSLIVEAKRKPIINMLEDIRIRLMERMFEVRNGYEGFKVDERLRTCTCRGYNQRACPSKNKERSAVDVVTPSTSTRGGKVPVRGGKTSARGGSTYARGGNTFARGGSTFTGGGKTPTRGAKTAASFAPSSPSVGFKMSASQVNGKVVRTRGRGDGSRSRMYPNGIIPIGHGVSWDLVDGGNNAR